MRFRLVFATLTFNSVTLVEHYRREVPIANRSLVQPDVRLHSKLRFNAK